MRVYLHSFSRCCLPNMPTSAKFWENLNLQQFRVIQGRWFWCQSKAHRPMQVPVSVINSNFGRILHRFWDTATYWLKIASFSPPLVAPAPYLPLEFHDEVKRQETRVMGLLCGEGCMILTSTVFDWSTSPVWRTDGRWHIIARYSIYYAVAVAR